MAKKLGDAFVRVRPDTSDFAGETKHRIGGALTKVVAGVAATAGGVIGVSLAKGFQRLNAIDQATAKLRGLGHSAAEVTKIMANSLTAVRGTAFGLDEAATVSASAVAAGIRPGRELTKTLKLVADAATIGGTSLSDMGAIFNKVATSNKLQGDVIAQLGDKGIPIVQLLSKTLHKSAADVVDLASKGKINFAQFQAAMQAGVGGAAQGAGSTFTGAMKNLMASVSRIGAGLLAGKEGKGGIFGALAPSISGVTKALLPLEDSAGKVGSTIGRALVPVFEKLPGLVSKVVNGLTSLHLPKLSLDAGKVGPAFKQLGSAIGSIDFGKLGGAAAQGAADSISVFAVVIRAAAKHTDLLAKAIPLLIVGFTAYKTAQAAGNVAAIAAVPTNLANAASRVILARAISQQTSAQLASVVAEDAGTAGRLRNTVATVASTVAQKAAAVASKVWAAGQWLLNAALSANPIGLVVLAIAALVAGFIFAYKKSTTFRNIVNGAFAAVKNVISNVLPVVAAVIRTYFNIYKTVIMAAFNVIRRVVSTTITGVAAVVRRGVGLVRAYFAGIGAIIGFVRRVFGAIRADITSRVAAAVAVVRSMIARIKTVFSGASGLLKGVGRSIIDGLISGIRAAGHLVSDAVSAIVNKIPKKVRQIMGISSPSKVMARLGRFTSDGLARGIRDGGSGVDQAVQRLAGSISAQAAARMAIPTAGVDRSRARARDLDSASTGGGQPLTAAGLAAAMDGTSMSFILHDGTVLDGHIRAIADQSVNDGRRVDDKLARMGARP